MHGASMTTRNIRRTGIPATKRGRPRKVNVVRDSNGKSRGEIVDFSVIMNQPHRREAKGDARKSELLGYPLGRLRVSNEVSEIQLRAGNEWALMVRSYAGMMGIPLGSPKSGSALNDAAKPGYAFATEDGQADRIEHDKRCRALRGRYDACFETLGEVGRSFGRSHAILAAMRRVCIEERYPNDIELGDLRIGLNAVAKEMGIR
jgi:hypothetical protein